MVGSQLEAGSCVVNDGGGSRKVEMAPWRTGWFLSEGEAPGVRAPQLFPRPSPGSASFYRDQEPSLPMSWES